MAKAALSPEEEFGFVPDVNDDQEFEFIAEAQAADDFGFIPDSPEEFDPAIVESKVNQSFNIAEQEQFDQVQFTNDVMRLPDTEIADPADINVTLDTLMTAERAESGVERIGFSEALKDKAGRPLELLPFVGPLYAIDRIGMVMQSAQRIQKMPNPPVLGFNLVPGEEGKTAMVFIETPQQLASEQVKWMRDRYVLAGWLTELEERQNRGLSVGGRIAEGVVELPSFMIEFLATGGVFEGAKQGTQRTIARLLQRSGEKFGKEFAEKIAKKTGVKLAIKTAGVLAGTAARTTAQFPRVLESALQRSAPGIEVTPNGKVVFTEAIDKPVTAIVKGFGDVYIENLSEIAGDGLGKFPFLSKFNDELRDAWLIANPEKTAADFTKTISRKLGYNGFVAELGEEQLSKALKAATGVETFGAKQTGDKAEDLIARMVAAIPNGTDLLVEAGVLAFPGAIRVAAGAAESIASKKPADITTGDISNLKNIPEAEQAGVFEAVNKEPIDRTSEDAITETKNRVAIVNNMSPKSQDKINAEAVDKVKGRISFVKPKTPIKKKLSDIALKADKAFRDEFAGLRKVVRESGVGKLAPADDPVQLAVAFTQKSSAKTRGFVLEATTDLAGNRKSKSLKQIFSPIINEGGKENFEDFVTYLVSARDINLQSRGKETGIDPVASRLTFDSLNSPQFAQAAKEVTEWNEKGIDLLVESGRITRESGEAIKRANPVYAPFFREFTEEEVVVSKGRGKKSQPKRLKGSRRKIIDPIEGMIQQMDSTIQSAQNAAIERSIANLATDNPEAFEDFIVPIKAPVKPTKFSVEEIKDQLEDVGIDFEGVAEEDLEELLTIFRPSSAPAPGVVTLTVDGKKKFFRVQQDLLDILEGTETYKLGPFWDLVAGKPTRLLKLGATGLNPAFGLIRNPIRDMQTFTVTSEFAKGGPLSAASGILKDVKTKSAGIAENFGFEGIKPDSDVQRFTALGGEMSGFISQDRQGTKHIQHEMLASNGARYTINTFKHPVDALRSLIGITEIGTRVGEFSAALKEGERLYGKDSLSASIFALNAAQDVTTNFTRHGQIGKQINQIIPFFNAAIQGPDKLLRSFKDRPLKSTAAAISTLTIPAIFFWWRNKDEPFYQNLTAHEKANYIHFKSPNDDNTVFRFPVPFELGHVFQAAPVAFLDAAYKKDPGEIKNILNATLNTSNPLDWPSLIGPVIDVKSNEDFAGRPIVSRANEGKLPKDQFGPKTTELMKVIGEQLNMSPSQIEHMTNSYTGGLYNKVARIFSTGDIEKQPADMPVIGTLFTRDPFAPKRQIQEFYEERKSLNQKFQSKDITLEENLKRTVLNNIAPVMAANFELLREAKTQAERKSIYQTIGDLIEFSNDVSGSQL